MTDLQEFKELLIKARRLNIDDFRKLNAYINNILSSVCNNPKLGTIELLNEMQNEINASIANTNEPKENLVNSQQNQVFWKKTTTEFNLSLSICKAQILLYLNRLQYAKSEFEESKKYASEQDYDSKATIEQSLGQICLQQREFDRAINHYKEAESAYKKAYKSHIKQSIPEAWEGIVPPEEQKDISCIYQEKAKFARQGEIEVLELIANVEQVRNNRDKFFKAQNHAIEVAQNYERYDLAAKMWLFKHNFELLWDVTGKTADESKQKLKSLLKELKPDENPRVKVDLLIQRVYNFINRKSNVNIENKLEKAKQIIEKNPKIEDRFYGLYLAYVEFYKWQRKLDEAIEYAEKAFEIAEQRDNPHLMDYALGHLIPLRQLLMKNPEQYQEQFGMAAQAMSKTIELLQQSEIKDNQDTLATSFLRRAFFYIDEGLYAQALSDLKKAEDFAQTPESSRFVLGTKSFILRKQGKIDEAYSTIKEAIDLSCEQLAPTGELSPNSWGDLIRQTESLYSGAAFIAAKAGCVIQAFDWAEQGKAVMLRQQLVQTGKYLGNEEWQIPHVSFNRELRTFLQEESAAVLMFCARSAKDRVEAGQTLAILIEPYAEAPKVFYVKFSENDPEFQEEKLKQSAWKNKDEFNQLLANLSNKLFSTTLEKTLEQVMNLCQVLYIVPDSRLSSIPFPALTLNNKALIEYEHCAIAIAPSVAILRWCCSRRFNFKERNCLALGVGEAEGYPKTFAQQVEDVIPKCGWSKETTWLLNEKATPKHFWLHAHSHSVIHFSCHGHEDEIGIDTLSALKLELTKNSELTAKDIFQCNPKLNADLVFLGACVSGRFRYRQGNSIGGFWQAFLYAGATTLIATLTEADASEAEQIARDFYQEWLQGNTTKAKALQKAQLKLRKKKPNSLGLAHYILVGDYI